MQMPNRRAIWICSQSLKCTEGTTSRKGCNPLVLSNAFRKTLFKKERLVGIWFNNWMIAHTNKRLASIKIMTLGVENLGPLLIMQSLLGFAF